MFRKFYKIQCSTEISIYLTGTETFRGHFADENSENVWRKFPEMVQYFGEMLGR